MFVKNLQLSLDYCSLGLPVPEVQPEFLGYILKNYDEYCADRKRPAVLILPGGAYRFTSQREATPVAMEFAAAGISSFVLHYSTAPHGRFPVSLLQVYNALQIIRNNADEWNIDPEKIVVCGFSAGGHLTASSGVFWNHELIRQYGFTDDSHKPNGLILSYPVISGGEWAHRESFQNLLGEHYSDEMVAFTSLETQVTTDTPRTFIWHTFEDNSVPVQNTMLFASALIEKNIPTELHIYPRGEHGLSIANGLVNPPERVYPHLSSWIDFAKNWVYNL